MKLKGERKIYTCVTKPRMRTYTTYGLTYIAGLASGKRGFTNTADA